MISNGKYTKWNGNLRFSLHAHSFPSFLFKHKVHPVILQLHIHFLKMMHPHLYFLTLIPKNVVFHGLFHIRQTAFKKQCWNNINLQFFPSFWYPLHYEYYWCCKHTNASLAAHFLPAAHIFSVHRITVLLYAASYVKCFFMGKNYRKLNTTEG
jgi:hypothetical protein